MLSPEKLQSFFESGKEAGTIFLCVDPIGRYKPSAPIDVYRGNQAGKRFREFIQEQIRQAKMCTYVPDALILRFDFACVDELPEPSSDMISTAASYPLRFVKYIEQNKIQPVELLSLRDMFIAEQCNLSGSPLAESSKMLSWIQNREKIYQQETEFKTPLIVAQTDKGYLIFSNNPVGLRGMKQFAQHVIDHYFDPHLEIKYLYLHYCEELTEQIIPYVDRSFSCDHLCYAHHFSPDKYTNSNELPETFGQDFDLIVQSDLASTSQEFFNLSGYFHDWHVTRTTVNEANKEIARLLVLKETGVVNNHHQPFSFSEAFRDLGERFEKVTQVRDPSQFNPKALWALQRETRDLADHFLKDEFDVRDHRSLVRILNDPEEKVVIGGDVELTNAQKTTLSSGKSLRIPADPSKGRPEFYAQIAENKESIRLTCMSFKEKIDTPKENVSYRKKSKTRLK